MLLNFYRSGKKLSDGLLKINSSYPVICFDRADIDTVGGEYLQTYHYDKDIASISLIESYLDFDSTHAFVLSDNLKIAICSFLYKKDMMVKMAWPNI